MKSSQIHHGIPPKTYNPYVLMERFNTEKSVQETANKVSQEPQRMRFTRLTQAPCPEDIQGKLFNSYVLLERLSPNEIQHLSNKKK